MKILETQSATLTNYEVLTHIQTKKERYDKIASARVAQGYGNGKESGIEFILRELTNYLEGPKSPLTTPSTYNSTTIRRLFEALQPYELTKAELVMFLNLRPNSTSVLDVVIEENDQRFSEETQKDILKIVADILGSDEGDEEMAVGGGWRDGQDQHNTVAMSPR
ncbi:MAG: hypothetical protein M1812_006270 [Candelaria pacifica]|nr:MAG: hypothetical protein M1812_006270 [Candelaria pacifica]